MTDVARDSAPDRRHPRTRNSDPAGSIFGRALENCRALHLEVEAARRILERHRLILETERRRNAIARRVIVIVQGLVGAALTTALVARIGSDIENALLSGGAMGVVLAATALAALTVVDRSVPRTHRDRSL